MTIFRDYKVFNGVTMLTHGAVLSIFDLAREQWLHHFPKPPPSKQKEHKLSKVSSVYNDDYRPKQCYFGIFENEITGIHFMTTNSQSIY